MRLSDIGRLVAEHGARRYAEKRGWAIPLAVGSTVPDIVRRVEHRGVQAKQTLDRAVDAQLAPDVAMKHAASWQGSYMHGGPGAIPPALMGIMNGAFGTTPHETKAPSGLKGFQTPSIADTAGHLGGQALSSLLGPALQAPGKALADHIGRALGPKRELGEKKDPLSLIGAGAASTFGKGLGEMGAGLLRDIASKAVAAVGSAGDNAARAAILTQLRQEDPVLSEADDKVLMEAYHTMSRFAPVLSTDKNAVRSFLRQAVMSGAGPDYASIKLLADSERAVTGDRE